MKKLELKFTFKKDKVLEGGKNLVPLNVAKAVSRLLENEVKMNFRQGGRPKKWKESIRAKEQGGKTLQDTGTLRNSIKSRVNVRNKELDITVFTNIEYAAIHNYGGTIKVTERMRGFLHGVGIHLKSSTKSIRMPKREFMILPDDINKKIASIYRSANA